MSALTLDIFWYIIVITALIFYTVLDGFDLGVGCLHLFTQEDRDRRVFLNSIGPVWDGNEVWLVIVGGALFAGFPNAFATIFSSFYVFAMLLVFGLIFRAVSIEFRSKEPSHRWRRGWDIAFSLASILIAFGTGLVLGNLVQGIPLDSHQDFTGNFLNFVRPYPILFGIATIALCSMHGAIYLSMKTEGALHETLKRWVQRCIRIFLALFILLTIATFYVAPYMATRLMAFPLLFVLPLAALVLIFFIPKFIRQGKSGSAFLCSCGSIALFLTLFPIGTFPILVRSSIDPSNFSVTIANSASSPLTLKILALMVFIGVPLVLLYGIYIYRVFRGKVRLDDHSY